MLGYHLKKNVKPIVKHPFFAFIVFGLALILLQILSWTAGFPKSSAMSGIATVLIYSIVGFGFTYLLGYAGLASLGTAGFTGLGAYIVGYFLRETGVPYIVTILVVLAVSIILGVAVGFISLRIEGIFLRYINEELGGVAKGTGEGALGYKLEATTYDDQGDGAQGKNYIQKLVEDDGVFALVGNLGTWNIVAAQDYIEESGVPSVYWGTGSSYQYFNPAQGNEKYTFPVQPIYNTEGRIMYLRAMQLASLEGSGVTSVSKIGVIHSSSDDGASIKAGIEEQRNINIQTNPDQPEVIFAQINSTTATELASQVQLVKDCDVVIIAGNQTYFQAAYTAMQTANVRKPVITSYVNIAPATVPNEATSAEASDIYGGAWVIIDDSADERQKADLLRFIAICDWGVEKGIISRSTADSYLISAYAMSSFIALDVFMTGIDRLADKEITREAFLEAMESAPINVPISGGVNYANGQRIGLDGMSFVKYVRPTEAGAAASTGTFVNVVGMQSIDQILGELDDAE